MAIQFTASNLPAKCKSSKNSGMVSVAALGICGCSRIGIYNRLKPCVLWVRLPPSAPAARQMDIGSVHDKDVRPKRVVISTKLPSPQFGSVAQLVEQQTKKERYNLSYSKVIYKYHNSTCMLYVRSVPLPPNTPLTAILQNIKLGI